MRCGYWEANQHVVLSPPQRRGSIILPIHEPGKLCYRGESVLSQPAALVHSWARSWS